MKVRVRSWMSVVYLAVAVVAAQARIVYTPVNVVISVNGGPYNIDLDRDGVIDFVLQSKLLQSYCQSGDGYSWSVTANPAQANNGVVAFPSPFGWFDTASLIGVQVGSNQTFYQDFAAMSEFEWGYCGTAVYGQWLNVPDRYLALEFQIVRNGIPETHYGWAKVSVAGYLDQHDDLQSVTFLSGFAYETVPGMAITTGQLSSAEKENHHD
jgi:hypothetical protein